jgi:CubicO group peptidase (beta-lactamase class C family)
MCWGVLIARASGKTFERFLRERIFEPLGIKDTGFSVPAAKLDRLAAALPD